MNTKKIILHTSYFILLVCTLLLAACGDENKEFLIQSESRTEQLSSAASQITLDVPFGSIELVGGGTSFSASVEYNSDPLKINTERGQNSVKYRQEIGSKSTISGIFNKWTVKGGSTPVNLDASMGNGDIKITGGAAQFSRLKAKIGSGSLTGTFDQPQASLTETSINIGSGNVNLTGLDNLSNGPLEIKVGSGNITLDYGEPPAKSHRSSVGTGSGDIKITVPAGVGVRIRALITTGNFNADGFNREGNTSSYYRNAAYEKGGNVLDLELNVSNGNIRVFTK